MFEETLFGSRKIALESRRYIGCKTKLLDWIFSLIDNDTHDVRSFCDIFAGTGVVAQRALRRYERVVINDFLFSNQVMYRAFFADMPWEEKKVEGIISDFNQLNPSKLSENYFSKNYGGRYFHSDTAKLVGYIRGQLKKMRSKLTDKEYAVLLASLIYSIDRQANTLGHFDAYQRREIPSQLFEMRMVDANRYPGAEIYREDANKLARKIIVDAVYLDPPYNSRQYSRFYHVYENLVKWQRPKLFGTALKPREENMSDYCRTAALSAFTDLVAHVQARYIVVSYNNTYKSKSSSSENKIKLEELEHVLRMCGETKVYSHQFNPFNSGKTEFDDHREYLFITEVDNERRNQSFSTLLCG